MLTTRRDPRESEVGGGTEAPASGRVVCKMLEYKTVIAHFVNVSDNPPSIRHKASAGDRTTTSVGKEKKLRKERKDRKEDKERDPPYRSGMGPRSLDPTNLPSSDSRGS